MTDLISKVLQTSSLAKIDPVTQLSEWATLKITGGLASTINQINQNSPLVQKLCAISAIFKEIRISIKSDEVGETFYFPITPSTINLNGKDNELVRIDTIAGKVNYKKDITLQTISFSSFFPNTYYSFSDSYKHFGPDCIEQLEKFQRAEKPITLIITGMGIVMDCYITKFEKNTSPENDIYYSIEFEEAKDPIIYEQEKNDVYVFKPKK